MIRGSVYILLVIIIAAGYCIFRLHGPILAESGVSHAYEKSTGNATVTNNAETVTVAEIRTQVLHAPAPVSGWHTEVEYAHRGYIRRDFGFFYIC